MQSLFNKRNKTNSTVSQLFSQPPTNIIQSEVFKHEVPTLGQTAQTGQIDEEPQNIHETQEQKAEKLSRTLFIGNIKVNTNKKDIRRLLQPYGKVQKIWYRSAPVEQSKIGPKASFILKKFNQDADSMNAYARFEDISSIEKALVLNGRLFNELTIRVTAADNKELDYEKTIFVGNLPFDTKEEELRQFCSKIGKIQNVRVIRNKFTHRGIGIAYVMFNTQENMRNAIKDLNGKTFKQRSIRVKKAVEKKRLEKKRNKYIDPKDANRNAAIKRIQQRKKETYRNQKQEKQPEKQSKSIQKHYQDKVETNPKQKKSTNNRQKRIPLNQKKRPQVVTQMDEDDKHLSNEVSQQLKLLKRKMISKKK